MLGCTVHEILCFENVGTLIIIFLPSLKVLINSSWDQITKQRIPNLRIFIMISFSTAQTEKKMWKKNWRKQDSLFGDLIL